MKDRYTREVGGTYFTPKTPAKVARIISENVHSGRRLRLYLGSKGKVWKESPNEITGTIGRSTGTRPIALLIKGRRSHGGGALLPDVTVGIQDAKTGKFLYTKKGYAPKIRQTYGYGTRTVTKRVFMVK